VAAPQINLAVIKVVGIGGGGVNAVQRMKEAGLKGVEFIAINTDAQALLLSDADVKLDIGRDATRGLGAGADPEVGRRAAEDHAQEIREVLEGADMVFVAAGEGGGTGTGGAPVVARIARELDALTVGVVTRPFAFEGKRREAQAVAGIDKLREEVDTLIVIPNERLMQVSDPGISILEAFQAADHALVSGVQGITQLITEAGMINVDFADVDSVMRGAGSALMGIGSASGEDRTVRAVEMAISSPLLEASIDGAHGVLLAFKTPSDIGLDEINRGGKLIEEAVHPEALIIWGHAIDDALGDEVRVTVIAAGFDTPPAGHYTGELGVKKDSAETPAPAAASPAAPASGPGAVPEALPAPAAPKPVAAAAPVAQTSAPAGDAVPPAPAPVSPFRPSGLHIPPAVTPASSLFQNAPAAPRPDAPSSDQPTSQVPFEPLFESTRRSQLSQKATAKPKDELNVPSWLNED
jgi:cell division protein FtsZ